MRSVCFFALNLDTYLVVAMTLCDLRDEVIEDTPAQPPLPGALSGVGSPSSLWDQTLRSQA